MRATLILSPESSKSGKLIKINLEFYLHQYTLCYLKGMKKLQNLLIVFLIFNKQ